MDTYFRSSKGIIGGAFDRHKVPYLPGVEKFLGGSDGNGGEGTLGKLLRQLPGDRRNLFGDLSLACKLIVCRFQLLRKFDDLLLLPLGPLGFPVDRPPLAGVPDSQHDDRHDQKKQCARHERYGILQIFTLSAIGSFRHKILQLMARNTGRNRTLPGGNASLTPISYRNRIIARPFPRCCLFFCVRLEPKLVSVRPRMPRHATCGSPRAEIHSNTQCFLK